MKRFPLWHVALIVCLCVLAYANTVSNAFVWDDEQQILQNPTLRSLSNIPNAFQTPFWGFRAKPGEKVIHFYRPLQTIAYTVGYWWAGGYSPVPDHLINIILHTIASVFVYFICLELGLPGLYGLLGAALFAVHPIHTEVVAWIAATPDAACGAFYFAAFWAFLRSDNGAKLTYLSLSAVLMFLALLSKEMALTLPAFVILYTLRPGGPALKLSRRIRMLVPYGVTSVVYLVMRANALGYMVTTDTDIKASLLDWVSLFFRVFGQYVQQTVIPYPLVAYHLVEMHFADRVQPTVAAFVLVVVLIGVAWMLRKRVPEAWFWYVAFTVLLAPALYLIGLSNTFLAERYLYTPSLAPTVLAMLLLRRAPAKAIWAGWAVVAIFFVVTVQRNVDWSDDEHMYAKTLEYEPDVAVFQINLADILLARGDDANAARHLNRAIEGLASGKYIQTPSDAYRARVGFAAILARAHNYEGARKQLDLVQQASPFSEWPYIYLGGIAIEAENDLPKALELERKAVHLAPKNDVAHDYLGIVLFNLNRLDEAQASFEQALRLNPTSKDARAHLDMAKRAMQPGL
jgi:tetratricopeptide (TPR) repeat protein